MRDSIFEANLHWNNGNVIDMSQQKIKFDCFLTENTESSIDLHSITCWYVDGNVA